jgi:hypothetical protein
VGAAVAYAGHVFEKGWTWLVVGTSAALFVLAFAMIAIGDDGWLATTGEALLIPVDILVIIFAFSILRTRPPSRKASSSPIG